MNRRINNPPEEKRKALRAFSDQAPKENSSIGSRFEIYWYFLAPLLVILVIVSLGLIGGWIYHNRTPHPNSQSADSMIFRREAGNIDHQAFVKTYIQAKGLKLNQLEQLKFSFRGTYPKGNEIVAFSGEADLMGNGRLRLAREMNRNELVFTKGSLERPVATVVEADRLAIRSLVSFFSDPLIEYAVNPEAFTAEMHLRQDRGIEVIVVELARIESPGKFSVTIDAKNLQTREVNKLSGSGKLRLRFSGHESKNGLTLPTHVATTDFDGQVSIIEMSDIQRL